MPCPRRPTASASAPARLACAGKRSARHGKALRAADRFAHLRATKREGDGLSFFESDHLDGDVDMIAVLKALLAENSKRSSTTDRVPAGSRPSHARRSRGNQAHQSRLYRDRPAARPRRTARRHPRHRTRRLVRRSRNKDMMRAARLVTCRRWNTPRRGRGRAICLAGSTIARGCFASPRRAPDARSTAFPARMQ
jgi:D-mannonate dehydratase